MADNFLELAMEDMRSGKINKTVSSRGLKPKGGYRGHVYIKDISEIDIDAVRKMVREGLKVSFSFPDGHEGSRLARTLGCFYRPISMGKPADANEL